MSGLTPGVLRSWRPELIEGCAGQVRANRDRLSAIGALLEHGRPAASAWDGAGARAARTRHTELVGEHQRLVAGVAATAAALAAAADEAAGVVRLLRHADDVAAAHGLLVLDSGQVVELPALAGPVDPVAHQVLAAARERARWESRDYLEQACRRAEQLDAALASMLVAAARGQTPVAPGSTDAAWLAGLATSSGPLLAPPSVVGEPPTPWDNAAWWSSLTALEQARAVEEHPDWVGPRDGVPAWARDLANRRVLDATEEWLVAEEERLRPAPGSPSDGSVLLGIGAGAGATGYLRWRFDDPEVRRAQAHRAVAAKLASVQTVRTVLAQQDGRTRQLLSVDVSGRLARSVVTVGDIDSAGHVAVFAGGFTTAVDRDLARYDQVLGRLSDLATAQSQEHGDRREVAAVVWMGYEAPQIEDLLESRTSVASWEPARVGGAALADFANGLDAARSEPAHLTLWGHSYGSTTAGVALRDHNTGVDDFAAFGSPGVGVDSVPQLHLPAGGFHVLEASDDVAADVARFGADPDLMRGADVLSAGQRPLPDGTAGAASHGHSQYLDLGTTSAWNLAAVAAGTAGLRVVEPRCAVPSGFAPEPGACRSRPDAPRPAAPRPDAPRPDAPRPDVPRPGQQPGH